MSRALLVGLFALLVGCASMQAGAPLPDNLTERERELLNLNKKECDTGPQVWLHVLNEGTAVRLNIKARQFGMGEDSVRVNRMDLRRPIRITRAVGLQVGGADRVDTEPVPCGHASIKVGQNPQWSYFCGSDPVTCAFRREK